MSYGLAIDPGISTGICLFSWTETKPFTREKVWQFSGGAEALRDWMRLHDVRPGRNGIGTLGAGFAVLEAFVVEKFTPQENQGFALTEAAAEPLRCEGVILGAGFRSSDITWQRPAAQYFMGGTDKASRKQNSRAFLKEHGLYLTGKQVDSPDADDAISATLHAVAHMRAIRHAPTLKEMFS